MRRDPATQVDNVEDLPAAVESLRKDPERAKRVAAAGQARFAKMGQSSVRKYVRDLLVQYAKLQRRGIWGEEWGEGKA